MFGRGGGHISLQPCLPACRDGRKQDDHAKSTLGSCAVLSHWPWFSGLLGVFLFFSFSFFQSSSYASLFSYVCLRRSREAGKNWLWYGLDGKGLCSGQKILLPPRSGCLMVCLLDSDFFFPGRLRYDVAYLAFSSSFLFPFPAGLLLSIYHSVSLRFVLSLAFCYFFFFFSFSPMMQEEKGRQMRNEETNSKERQGMAREDEISSACY